MWNNTIKARGAAHRSLGNHVAEELLIDGGAVASLLEVEPKQHADLRLVRLVRRIHLERTEHTVTMTIHPWLWSTGRHGERPWHHDNP